MQLIMILLAVISTAFGIRGGFMKKRIVILVVLVAVLGACSEEEVLKMKDKDFNTLNISSLSGKVEDPIVIKDNKQVNKVLEMVEGLKVKADKDIVEETTKLEDAIGFAFTKDDKLKTGRIPYTFYILKNDKFMFPQDKINSTQTPRVTIKKQPELAKKIKKIYGINF